jgi:hypothetical protein
VKVEVSDDEGDNGDSYRDKERQSFLPGRTKLFSDAIVRELFNKTPDLHNGSDACC